MKYSNDDDHETKISKLLTNLEREKEDLLHKILLNEIKLEKLRILETKISAIKRHLSLKK